MNHTPGPWFVYGDDTPWTCGDSRTAIEQGEELGHTEILFSCRAGDKTIAFLPWLPIASAQEQATLRANARLIAAAPDILAALKLVRDELAVDFKDDLDCFKRAEAAIAKASRYER